MAGKLVTFEEARAEGFEIKAIGKIEYLALQLPAFAKDAAGMRIYHDSQMASPNGENDFYVFVKV